MKVKIGILGAASIAYKVVGAICMSDIVEVGAVGSRDKKKAEALLQEFGLDVSLAVEGYEGVLEKDIDALYIPLPTGLHMEWVQKCANKKLHLLLEKPIVLTSQELQEIEKIIRDSGIQFMDGTMWLHHPRTTKMKQIIDSVETFGDKLCVVTNVSILATPDFLANNIRVKKGLDALGCIGDLGWYCIRSALWAFDFEMPSLVQAHPYPQVNSEGVVVDCGATMVWKDGKRFVFTCSFNIPYRNWFEVSGSKGTLQVSDFIIPFNEHKVDFVVTSNHEISTYPVVSSVQKQTIEVNTQKSQEWEMLDKFSELVTSVKNGGKADDYWLQISVKTQKLVCAVQESIDQGCHPIQIDS
eukprot:TRINITY_DN39654_c0_g1_i5.p1 TRINITY_DN39654_c0_g1~~TRINITY_DN39654_c0_g1_i5.p1  ORF type:complete len:364 (-),score=44.32 TRINITY_DN39654_c0_g1_i5:318-1382(-)